MCYACMCFIVVFTRVNMVNELKAKSISTGDGANAIHGIKVVAHTRRRNNDVDDNEDDEPTF